MKVLREKPLAQQKTCGSRKGEFLSHLMALKPEKKCLPGLSKIRFIEATAFMGKIQEVNSASRDHRMCACINKGY